MRYLALFILVFWFNKPSYATDFKLNFPVLCKLGTNCWVLNYMDSNPTPRIAEDHTCGGRTYEGHTGSDIAVRDLKTADNGIFVMAAADGRVIETRSGFTDQFYNPQEVGTNTCGNGVIIEHKDGWQTQYCHMKQNSITVERIQHVQAGQILGQIGLSGATSWPHLGFTVLRNGTAFDPFSGRTSLEGCGLSPQSLFIGAKNIRYQPFAIFNLGYSVGPPNENQIALGQDKLVTLPSNTPTLTFWASSFGMAAGDRVTLSLISPDDQILAQKETVIEQAQSKAFFTLTHTIGNGLWASGSYRGLVKLERGAGHEKDVTEWQRVINIVE